MPGPITMVLKQRHEIPNFMYWTVIVLKAEHNLEKTVSSYMMNVID